MWLSLSLVGLILMAGCKKDSNSNSQIQSQTAQRVGPDGPMDYGLPCILCQGRFVAYKHEIFDRGTILQKEKHWITIELNISGESHTFEALPDADVRTGQGEWTRYGVETLKNPTIAKPNMFITVIVHPERRVVFSIILGKGVLVDILDAGGK